MSAQGRALTKRVSVQRLASATQLFPWQAQRFETPSQAQATLSVLAKKWRYHQGESAELIEPKRYGNQGRPTACTPRKALEWQMQARGKPDAERLEVRKQHQACCVLGTNSKAEQRRDAEGIAGDKGQAHAEGGCRLLKDPLLFVSALFVKKPCRIQGLLMVMTLALLVYLVAQCSRAPGIGTSKRDHAASNQPADKPSDPEMGVSSVGRH